MLFHIMDLLVTARLDDIERSVADARRLRSARAAVRRPPGPREGSSSASKRSLRCGTRRTASMGAVAGRKLRLSSIWSEDLNNLLPFYRDVVGLPVRVATPRFVVLGEPGSPGVGLGTHSEVHGKTRDPARHIVGLEVDDLRSEIERLKAGGVEFIEERLEEASIRTATFRDPEGNLLQLLQFRSPA